jgi:glycosyltransferase A (GT-A) superfamily protein (DUF2064 family)
MPGRLLVIAPIAPEADLTPEHSVYDSIFRDALLTDTIRLASHPAIAADLLLALDGSSETLPPDAARDVRCNPQRGNSLGDRLVHIFGEGFGAGHTAVGVIGSSTPDLPVAFVQEAFGRLERDADALFGPADDGGYYLVALRQPHPELFVDIPWGTGAVLEALLKAATAAGVKTALLPGWHLVDGEKERDRLRTDLRRGTAFAPATAALLETEAAGELPANTQTIWKRESSQS